MSILAATPQFYTPDDVSSLLAADFTARGINAAVEVGEWDPEQQRGEPRVIVGYGKGRVGEPAGHYQPGAYWIPPGTTGEVARAMLDDAQTFVFTVHAPAVGTTEGAATGARRATDQLKRATFAALRRMMQGPFREAANVDWPKPPAPSDAGGYQGWTYGSVCTFELVLASPILDDAEGVIGVASVSTDSSFLYPDNTSTQPETNSGATA
jgi:hypothetical protein